MPVRVLHNTTSVAGVFNPDDVLVFREFRLGTGEFLFGDLHADEAHTDVPIMVGTPHRLRVLRLGNPQTDSVLANDHAIVHGEELPEPEMPPVPGQTPFEITHDDADVVQFPWPDAVGSDLR